MNRSNISDVADKISHLKSVFFMLQEFKTLNGAEKSLAAGHVSGKENGQLAAGMIILGG